MKTMLRFIVCFFVFVLIGVIADELGSPDRGVIEGAFCAFLVFKLIGKKNKKLSKDEINRREFKKAEKERKQQYQEKLKPENRQYADELAKKDRIIRDLQSRNSELQRSRQSSSSTSQKNNWRQEEEERRQDEQWERQQEQKWEREQEQKKKERLEDWYREYVTIEVSFDYHIKDSEYNQDYWDHRSEDIRVTRREAMALIQAGEGALLGRLGYTNRGNIRNVGYKTPYGLYDRPWNC